MQKAVTLRVAGNLPGYVYLDRLGQPKPYKAQVSLGNFATAEEAALRVARFPDHNVEAWAQLKSGGKKVCLGNFATAEEAALCVARSPEGKAAAQRAAAALTSEEALQQAQAEELTLTVADNKTGYYGVYLKPGQPKPYQAQVSRGGKRFSSAPLGLPRRPPRPRYHFLGLCSGCIVAVYSIVVACLGDIGRCTMLEPPSMLFTLDL